MTGFWINTQRSIANVAGSDPDFDKVTTIALNSPDVHNGDKVARILVSYSLYTSLHENSLVLQNKPDSWCVTAWYRPDPQADPHSADSPDGALAGDALYSDVVRWRPTRWTDGSIHSTQWYAESDGVVSCRAERVIVDKTAANLRIGIELVDTDFFSVGVTVSGWLWMKALIERRFG